MPDITNYIFDTTYIEQTIKNLKDIYQIEAYIVDNEGNAIEAISPTPIDTNCENSCQRFYRFEFTEDIGGLMCISSNEEAISNAEWFIDSSITAINNLLQRELEIQQMTAEIMELSEQINFLFNLSKNVIGIKKLYEFCSLSLQEIAKKIQADKGFIVVKDAQDTDIVIPYNFDINTALDIQNHEVFKLAIQKKRRHSFHPR